MVYGFIIHSITADKKSAAAQQQQQQQQFSVPTVYLSQYYTSEGNDDNTIKRQSIILARVLYDYQFRYGCENTKPDERLHPDWAVSYIQRQKEQQLITQMSMQPGGYSGSSSSSSSTSPAASSILSRADSSYREGIFKINPSQSTPTISSPNDPLSLLSNDYPNLFTTPKYVVWKNLLGVCFTMICDQDENRLLAASFLTSFSNILVDYYKSILSKSSPQEIFSRSDEILVLLNSYMPNGQLLYSSQQFAKHIKSNVPTL
ncbi:hypothetical protein DFA_07670 [Cavenderia fasciculata]|uniref:Uncharacterized protein n=1 Tax=Cavenderia fasciculata TaxID=261658 RepID=F4Q2L3_CACFS|nr:uncharacterized protein DFA_07670 [Cavenderia fasciculata]EGG16692.1 hypothetical protein DFA_07670 [Cavenderia fasciculata]|eukprot:XP_004355166.1 hypothetical protein DFA_07670 [Cavenderia fasciculata]